ANASVARIRSGIIFIRRPAVQYTARGKVFIKLRKILLRGPVGELGLFFGIEVIEVAERLIESVKSWQVLIAVTEMVLAKLPGRVTQRLQQFGNGWVLRLKTDCRSGHSNLGKTGTESALPRDE